MAMAKDRPLGFREAIQVVSQILSKNHDLVSRGLVDVEAEQIVMAAYRYATGRSLNRLELFSRMREAFPARAGDKVLEWAHLRAEGQLLQHLLGYQAFLNHEYEVSPDVLVPRPETELLVVTAIEELKKLKKPSLLGIEVGLGSGVISIELLHAFLSLHMLGSELQVEARDIALRNAEKILGAEQTSERFECVAVKNASEVLEPFFEVLHGRRADFLISNPPYLLKSNHESIEVDSEVFQYEPHVALFAPESDPLYFYQKIKETVSELLTEEGQVFLEIPHERAQAIYELFEGSGWKSKLVQDLNQRDRILIANKKKG